MRTWRIDHTSIIAVINGTPWSTCLQACDRSPLTQHTDGQQRQRGGKRNPLRNQCCCPDVASIWSLKTSLWEGGVCVCMCVCVCVRRLPRGLGFRHGTRQGVFSPSLSPACLLLLLLVCAAVRCMLHAVHVWLLTQIIVKWPHLCKGSSIDHRSLTSPLPMMKDTREQQGWESRL